jgi:tRNA threonylcarbamoyladenosine biosynthesis protein TsaB
MLAESKPGDRCEDGPGTGIIMNIMKVLSIETSTLFGGVAVLDEKDGLIAEARLSVKSTHSERLMTTIDHVLRQSELSIDSIDAFAIASGPGSFTGLRIGLSTAKGLSFSTGKPLVAVPTLQAFAWNFPCCVHPVCLMLDARKGEVYAALFQWQKNGFVPLMSEMSVKPNDLVHELRGTVLLAGEGVRLYWDMIKGAMGERAVMAPPDKMMPSPSNVAVLGLARALKGDFTDAASAEPLYIRRSEAEVKWEERH